MVQRLVDMSSRPEATDDRFKVEADVNAALRARSISVTGNMVFGRIYHILEAVDIDAAEAEKKHGAEVIALVEQYRDRVNNVVKTKKLKPSNGKTLPSVPVTEARKRLETDEVLREIAEMRSKGQEDYTHVLGVLRGTIPPTVPTESVAASSKYLKKREFPTSINAWTAQEKLEFIAHVREEAAGEEFIGDFLEMHGVRPAQYEFWLMNRDALERSARNEASEPTRVKTATPVEANGKHAETNGHTESAESPEFAMVIERNPLLPEKGFTGRWTDTERCTFIVMWDEAAGNPRMQQALLEEYDVSRGALYNWKKKFEVEKQVEETVTGTAQETAAAVADVVPDTATTVQPSSSHLPAPGPRTTWEDANKLLILDEVARLRATKEKGVLGKFLKQYGLDLTNAANWEASRRAIEHRIRVRAERNQVDTKPAAELHTPPTTHFAPRQELEEMLNTPAPATENPQISQADAIAEVAQAVATAPVEIADGKKTMIDLQNLQQDPNFLECITSKKWGKPQRLAMLTIVDQYAHLPSAVAIISQLYGLSTQTIYNWRKWRAEQGNDITVEDAASATSDAVSTVVPGISEPLKTKEELLALERDPRLPGEDYKGRWPESARRLLVEIYNEYAHIRGAVERVSNLYGIHPRTLAIWRQNYTSGTQNEVHTETSTTVQASPDTLEDNATETSVEPSVTVASPLVIDATQPSEDDSALPPPRTPIQDWTRAQKLRFVDLVKANPQRGFLAKMLKLYDVGPSTYQSWKGMREKEVAPIAETTATAVALVMDQSIQTPDVTPSQQEAIAATPEVRTLVVDEALRRRIASLKPHNNLDEFSYLIEEVLPHFSAEFDETMILTVATLLGQIRDRVKAKLGEEPSAEELKDEIAALPPTQQVIVVEEVTEPEAPVLTQEAAIAEVAQAVAALPVQQTVAVEEPTTTQQSAIAEVVREVAAAPAATAVVETPAVIQAPIAPVELATVVESEASIAERERRRVFVSYMAVNYQRGLETYDQAYELALLRCNAMMQRALEARGIYRQNDVFLFERVHTQGLAALLARFNSSRDGSLSTFIRDHAAEEIDRLHAPAIRAEATKSAVVVHLTEKGPVLTREATISLWVQENNMGHFRDEFGFRGAMIKRNMRWVYELSEELRNTHQVRDDKKAIDQKGYDTLRQCLVDYPFESGTTPRDFTAYAEPIIKAAMLSVGH